MALLHNGEKDLTGFAIKHIVFY